MRRPIPAVSTVESPCIRNCCLDPQDVCMGCGRTLTEIQAWHALDTAQRAQVLALAAERSAIRNQRFPR